MALASSEAAAAPPKKRAYRRRRPEEGVLHQVVREHLETFLAERRAADPEGQGVPCFVEKGLRKFLRCGDLAHGFARFRCDDCRAERLVAFSCKVRGLCPSCDGRRMTERAADLVDRVLPHVPLRQWVLSLPYWLRWRCAFDHELTKTVLGIFERAVAGWLRDQAKKMGHPGGLSGSVTVIQRFGGGANLNVHFHTLRPDGVWTEGPDGALTFHPVPAPTEDELEALCETIARRVERCLVRRGLWLEDDEGGRPADLEELPPLADLYQDAVTGKGTRRLGGRMPLEPGTQLGQTRRTRGAFDLHAGVAIRADDRDAVERLGRYLLRPSVVDERLERLPNGDVLIRLKTPWADGTHHLQLTPSQFLARLAVLIPRPESNAVIYHGVFAANHRWRERLVPALPPEGSACRHEPTDADESPATSPTHADESPVTSADPPPPSPSEATTTETTTTEPATAPSASAPPAAPAGPVITAPAPARPLAPRPNHTWADLMRRGLDIDSLECPKQCGGRLRLIALIEQPAVARRILEHLDLDGEPVEPAPARAPPLPDDWDWGA